MSRLIDDLRAGGNCAMPWFISLVPQWTAHSKRIHEFLSDPIPVVVAEKLAASYFACEQERWDMRRDFGDLRPVHSMFWVEHKMPRVIHSLECGDSKLPQNCQNGRVGIFFLAPRAADCKGEGIPDNAAWILMMETFVDYGQGRKIQGPIGSWFLAIDAEGKVIEQAFMQGYHDPAHNEIMQSFLIWLHPALLAVPFLRAKPDEMEIQL